MNSWQIALLFGAVVASILSFGLPRAQLWILAGAVSFVFSTAWQRYDLPFHPAFTLACDACVCLAIYFFGREKWEIALYRIFQASVLTSLVFLVGPIEIAGHTFNMGHYGYVVFLEAWNWAALLVIGGMGLAEKIGGRGYENFPGLGWASGFLRSLHFGRTARETQPFHKVPK